MNCAPCELRGRITEALHTVAGEPWCKWCYNGAMKPNDPLQLNQRERSQGADRSVFFKLTGQCKRCGNGITSRNKSGYCTPCGKLPGMRRAIYPSYTVAMETKAWKKYRKSKWTK
jgi:hypothetical protein